MFQELGRGIQDPGRMEEWEGCVCACMCACVCSCACVATEQWQTDNQGSRTGEEDGREGD